jgi:tetratricopeptide (TPR) repeat protein
MEVLPVTISLKSNINTDISNFYSFRYLKFSLESVMMTRYSENIREDRIIRACFFSIIFACLLFAACSSPEKKLEEAREHYTKGREAYMLFTPKSLEEAIGEYQKAMDLDKNNALPYAGLGEAYSFLALLEEQNYDKKDSDLYDKSLQYSQKAVELAPALGESHRALASSYRALGKFEEGKTEAEKAIELNPRDSEAYYLLWTVTGADPDNKNIEKALELDPNLSIAHSDLGYIYYTKGKYEESTEHLRRAIEINPDLIQAHTNLGLTLAAQKKFGEAEEKYRRAIEINSDYLLAHYNLGVALGSHGKFDEAISEFEKAIQINPDFPEAYITLALAYENKGDREKALEQYQKFVDLASANKSRYEKLVAEAGNRIKKLQKDDE